MIGSRWNIVLGSALVGAYSLLLPSDASAVLFQDGVFQPITWTVVVILDDTPTGAVFDVDQVQADGHPDEFRRTRHAIAGGSIILGHLMDAAIYEPNVSGTLVTLNFSFDLRFLGGSPGTSQVGYRLLLEQDGFLYYSEQLGIALGPGSGLPGAWTPFAFFGLTAASFHPLPVGSPGQPDFSAAGHAIRLGFLTTNTASVPIDVLSGIDNWTVTASTLADVLPSCAGPAPGVPWKNHGQFVSQVARIAQQLVADGVIPENEKDVIVSQAAQSSCG